MKLEFLSFEGGGGKGWSNVNLFRAPAEPRPLDDASHIIKVGALTGGGFFGALLLFSVFAPISGAAIAEGEVTTSGSSILVQPLSGGLVSNVLVTEGQSVKAGQPLVRLNGLRSEAKAQQAQSKRDSLRALQARLLAERDGLAELNFPMDLTRRSSEPTLASALAAQAAIFRTHRDILAAERAIAETEQRSAVAQHSGAGTQLRLIQDELSVINGLYQKGYATLSRVRALQRSAAELRAQTGTGEATVARSRLESAKLAKTQMLDTLNQLREVEDQLAQVEPDLRVLRFDEARDTLRAPVAGRVSGVTKIGPGTVLGTGTTVMEIVPDGRAMIVEAMVRPEDIDDIKVGSAASLRFTTVNPRGQSSFDGKVMALSPARVPGRDGTGQFRAQIMMDDPGALKRNNVNLQPGLPVTVHIKTHERSLFNYLFAPVEDSMSGAFREE